MPLETGDSLLVPLDVDHGLENRGDEPLRIVLVFARPNSGHLSAGSPGALALNAIRAYRALLTNRALTRLLVGEFVSSIGDWLYLVALLVVVYARTQDPVLLGIVGATRVLPYVLLSVPAGIAADRFDRRRILIATDVARGAIMVVLAYLVATDGPVEWIVGARDPRHVLLDVLRPDHRCLLADAGRRRAPARAGQLGVGDARQPRVRARARDRRRAHRVGGLTLAFVLNAVSFAVVAFVLAGLPSTAPLPAA